MSTRTPYDRALSLDPGSASGFAVLALAAHLVAGSVLARHARAAMPEPALVTTEVEFVAPPPPPPPPETAPPAPPEEEHIERVVTPTARPAAPSRAASAPAAKAGAVITASAGSDAPVSFATDPNGGEYGSGVVASNGVGTVGGTGTGTAPPSTATKPIESAPPPPPPPPKRFATPPRLTEANACRGFFPASADDDAATVAVVVTVQPNGSVTTASVASESPKGQGFGAAARACVLSRKFQPATGEDGAPMVATATVNVHFSR